MLIPQKYRIIAALGWRCTFGEGQFAQIAPGLVYGMGT